jgi:NAD-reducing hydrogenase small subunit
MGKARISTLWLSGCHMSLLDLDEALVELLSGKVEIVKSPPLTDVKEHTPVDVGIVEGAVATEEDEEELRKFRDNCKILVAIGDCACFGGITSYRNLFDKDEVLSRVFVETESVVDGKVPASRYVPKILDKVKAVGHIVKVEAHIPGCPPSPRALLYALKELLEGRIPILPSDMASFE